MAETFDQYLKLKNRTKPTSWMTVEDKVEAAMDQGELLRGVCARVQAFLDYYEGDISETLKFVAEVRERGAAGNWKFQQQTADLAELDAQTIASSAQQAGRSEFRLLLDDLKVLMDQIPEGYHP